LSTFNACFDPLNQIERLGCHTRCVFRIFKRNRRKKIAWFIYSRNTENTTICTTQTASFLH